MGSLEEPLRYAPTSQIERRPETLTYCNNKRDDPHTDGPFLKENKNIVRIKIILLCMTILVRFSEFPHF